ncbi:MAG TPA: hypothetical protein VJT72_04070 [Pseudonocardiaceae bacterium]|nr:hypothetical protein [Pseudonocardiaceae bacterium]
MGRQTDHYLHRPGRIRRPSGLLLGLLCAMLLASVGVITVITVTLLTMLLAFGPFVLAGVGAFTVARHLHRRRRRVGRGQHPKVAPPRPTAPVAGPPPVPDWRATRARFAELRSEYSRFECDPLAVLRLPALADVTVASTGRFVDAFAEAQALDTDTEPPAVHRVRFATAVEQAWHAWHAARDAAERIRLAGIPAPERATVQRAIKLLTMARDSDHDAERIAAYAKARAELAKLDRSGTLRLPFPAAAALDAAARGQLPPAAATG